MIFKVPNIGSGGGIFFSCIVAKVPRGFVTGTFQWLVFEEENEGQYEGHC